MTATVTYITVNGVLMMETRGGVDTAYVPDTLGNLVQCRDASGNKTYEAWYWPYGEVRASTGTNPSPWGFVGLLGYLVETATRLYVRARHYRADLKRWMTVDPLWPREFAYIYARFKPNYAFDPSGLYCIHGVSTSPNCSCDCYPGYPDRCTEKCKVPPPPSPTTCSPDQAFNPSSWPVDFGYGRCCGGRRACNKSTDVIKDGLGNENCLDAACRNHDTDIPTVIDYLDNRKHCALLQAVLKCDCNKMYAGDANAVSTCEAARAMLIAYSGSHCFLLA